MAAEKVRFDAFELDLASGDLKKDGRGVKLSRQPSQLLVLLVRNAGSVVTREEIQNTLWPDGTVVDYDQSINFCVKRIRDVLGDDPASPHYLETVPRRGYRFLGEIVPGVEAARKLPARLRWALAATGLAAAVLAVAIPWSGSRGSDTAVRRFAIPIHLYGAGIPFDLSPDGSTIVYSTEDANGRRVLYRRPVDGFESTLLEEAYGRSPFFSPDGNWVGYLAGSVLRKVRLQGGPSMLVSDSVFFGERGASWSEDGVIVVNGEGGGPFYRVPASAGEAEAFTRIDVDAGDLAHVWPQVIPGGEWVLFTIVERPGFDNTIVAQSLRTGERREVFRGGSSGCYVASGHLVYARSGTLLAVRFDPESLTVSGDPVPVLEGVETREFDGRALFRVARNGTLAYVPAVPRPRSSLAWYRRDGSHELVDLPPLSAHLTPGARVLTPRISPDGRRLAISIGDVVWLYDLELKTEIRLSQEKAGGWVEWSPSGESIAYLGMGAGGFEIVVRSVKRMGDATTVYRGPTFLRPVSWLPGDRGLLYWEIHRETTGGDIMLLDPVSQDAEPRPLLDSPAHEMNAQISPDGRLLAYSVYDPTTGDEARLNVCTYPELERCTAVSPGWGWGPLWSRDGTELFFQNKDRRRLMVVDVTLDSELKVSEPRVLLSGNFRKDSGGSGGTHYDVSPDGERFLMVVEEELPETTPQIHIVLDWLSELERKMAS